MINLPALTMRDDPFPHAIQPDFLPRHFYDELLRTFPRCPPNVSPTGYSLYRGDPEYDALIETNAAWRTLYELTHSQEFVDYSARQFASSCRDSGCTIDLARARYVDYRETRTDKECRDIAAADRPSGNVWVRTDILQGNVGYDRPPHVDHRRRVLTYLIYFCDAEESGISGGELVLYSGNALHLSKAGAVRPQHNLLVAFPCSNHSIHAVSRIEAARSPRNHIQIHVSASHDVWPSRFVSGHSRSPIGRAVSRLLVGEESFI